MNTQDPYLPADKQDIDNIPLFYDEGEREEEPDYFEDPEEEILENFIFIGVGAVIMVVAFFAYLHFIN
jgi:hypothetical protein